MNVGDRVVCKGYFISSNDDSNNDSDLCGVISDIHNNYVELYLEEYDMTIRVSSNKLHYEVNELLKII